MTLCCAPDSFTRFALGPRPSSFSHHCAVPEAQVVGLRTSSPHSMQTFMRVPHVCTATLLSLLADAHLLPFPLTIKDLAQVFLVLLNLLLLQTSPNLSLCLCSCLLHPRGIMYHSGQYQEGL